MFWGVGELNLKKQKGMVVHDWGDAVPNKMAGRGVVRSIVRFAERKKNRKSSACLPLSHTSAGWRGEAEEEDDADGEALPGRTMGVPSTRSAAARSAAITVAAPVCPPGMTGSSDASTTRTPSTPHRRKSAALTAESDADAPMRHEPTTALPLHAVRRT